MVFVRPSWAPHVQLTLDWEQGPVVTTGRWSRQSTLGTHSPGAFVASAAAAAASTASGVNR